MMFPPETFISSHADKSYEELIDVRDELIRDIKQFEENPTSEDSDFIIICPGPDVVYQMHLEYLSAICKLIIKKFREQQGLED